MIEKLRTLVRRFTSLGLRISKSATGYAVQVIDIAAYEQHRTVTQAQLDELTEGLAQGRLSQVDFLRRRDEIVKLRQQEAVARHLIRPLDGTRPFIPTAIVYQAPRAELLFKPSEHWNIAELETRHHTLPDFKVLNKRNFDRELERLRVPLRAVERAHARGNLTAVEAECRHEELVRVFYEEAVALGLIEQLNPKPLFVPFKVVYRRRRWW
jgi:hypothetical protein